MEKVPVYVTQWGALNVVQQEYFNMLSVGKVQKHLRYQVHKQLHNLMHYLHDDLRVMYHQLMTAAQKAQSGQKERPEKGVWVRLV